eukprot:1137272-Pelagomonas_calceolata.AAC.2
MSAEVVTLHTILLGVVGTCYAKHTLNQLGQLGLDHQRAIKLARKLHAHSVMYANKLVTSWHATENKNSSQPGPGSRNEHFKCTGPRKLERSAGPRGTPLDPLHRGWGGTTTASRPSQLWSGSQAPLPGQLNFQAIWIWLRGEKSNHVGVRKLPTSIKARGTRAPGLSCTVGKKEEKSTWTVEYSPHQLSLLIGVRGLIRSACCRCAASYCCLRPCVFTVFDLNQVHVLLVCNQLMGLSYAGSCAGPLCGAMPAV